MSDSIVSNLAVSNLAVSKRTVLKTIWGKLFGTGSKATAKNRLQFVLVQDRAGLNNEELTQFKREILSVVQKYFVIDEAGFDISYKRANDSTTLQINSPIVVKRQNFKSNHPRVANGVSMQNSNGANTNNSGSNNNNNNQNRNSAQKSNNSNVNPNKQPQGAK